MRSRRFWLLHAWLPGVVFVAALAAIQAFDLDRRIAVAWFFDRGTGAWLGADTWWAVDLLHTGGALMVRALGLVALGVWAAGLGWARLRPWRRPAGYVVLALLLCTSLVAGLKQVTRVDCPGDVAGFGGGRPYATLLSVRAQDESRGRCFPGSHAASGFALLACYFALLDRRPALARAALVAALAIGIGFSVGQQSRGAHFLSHDLTSAGLVWFLLLVLWQRLLESPAPDLSRLISAGPRVQARDGTSPRGPGHVSRPATHPAHARGRRAGLRGVFRRLLPAPLSLRAAAPERRPGGHPRRGAGDARQGDAQDG